MATFAHDQNQDDVLDLDLDYLDSLPPIDVNADSADLADLGLAAHESGNVVGSHALNR